MPFKPRIKTRLKGFGLEALVNEEGEVFLVFKMKLASIFQEVTATRLRQLKKFQKSILGIKFITNER
jgi:hypothetical protein